LASATRRHLSAASAAAAAAAAGAAPEPPAWVSRETLNPNVLRTAYAVRGEMVLRAQQHQRALEAAAAAAAAAGAAGDPAAAAAAAGLPFSRLTFCNIGNPQELGQRPLTFFRQVSALVQHPALLDSPLAPQLFPPDALARARAFLGFTHGAGLGAYTHSMGIEGVRREVAAAISERDGGVPAHAEDIFLTDGASPAVQMVLKALIRGPRDAVLVPVPQYPLYSASIALYGGTMANVYLNEARGWSLERAELERALAEARGRGLSVRALVVINPGNPTGNSLSAANVRDVIDFASRERLVLMADEVYQENVWAPARPFVSFKRVAAEMGLLDAHSADAARHAANGARGLQLASFHSTSKGYTGECGRRGGYVELCGFDEAVRAELYKLASISLCGNTAGQLVVGLQARPPRPGEASYALFSEERDAILASLRRRAERLVGALRGLEGVSCEEPEGALYAFPQLALPARAVAAARAAGKQPDTFYCLALLDATGIVVVPGSGFGQREGTWHFRSTILPPERDFDNVVAAMARFHRGFMDKYR